MALEDPVVFDFENALGLEAISRARSLRPLLAKHAQTHEDIGELVPEVVEALDRAELLKMSAPRRLGGLALSSATMAEVSRELAKGCPSTAWVVSIVNSCVWIASTLAPAMQDRIFADGIPITCGPNNGMGQIVEDEGGCRVSGKWGYGSSSHHAKWALVPALDGAGNLNMVLLPMTAVTIEKTWDVAGMKGTGSDTLVAQNVALAPDMLCQMSIGSAVGETPYVKEPSDYWVAFPLLRAKALGVLLGSVEGLFEAVVELKDKPIIYSAYTKRSDSAVWQAGIGSAAARIGIARSVIEKHNQHNDAAAVARRTLTLEERAACRGECAMVGEMLIRTVDDLMDLAGSSAFATKMSTQRFWRDFSIGIRHVIFNANLGYEVLGKVILEVEPNVIALDQI